MIKLTSTQLIIFFLIPFIFGCKEVLSENFDSYAIEIKLKMEVHVVNKDLPIYSIPETKTYLYSYVQNSTGQITQEDKQETITCKNGWAVKESVILLNENEVIYLGATIKFPPDENYQVISLAYDEIERFINSDDTTSFTKTFTIYE